MTLAHPPATTKLLVDRYEIGWQIDILLLLRAPLAAAQVRERSLVPLCRARAALSGWRPMPRVSSPRPPPFRCSYCLRSDYAGCRPVSGRLDRDRRVRALQGEAGRPLRTLLRLVAGAGWSTHRFGRPLTLRPPPVVPRAQRSIREHRARFSLINLAWFSTDAPFVRSMRSSIVGNCWAGTTATLQQLLRARTIRNCRQQKNPQPRRYANVD